jgi:hypothetical protein
LYDVREGLFDLFGIGAAFVAGQSNSAEKVVPRSGREATRAQEKAAK